MSTIFTKITLISSLALLVSCSSKDSILPQHSKGMLEIYEEQMNANGVAGQNLRLLSDICRPEVYANEQAAYTRTSGNEINSLFPRLPNPDLTMYVFPHLSKKSNLPVPGYSTVFSFYEKTEYAMPGEVNEMSRCSVE